MIQQNEIDPKTGVAETKSTPKLTLGSGSLRRVNNANRTFGQSQMGGSVGMDLDDYTPYTGLMVNTFDQDLDAMRAGSQGGLELLGKGIGNFLTTGLGEIAKMPGYLMGLGDATAEAMQTGEFNVEKAVNNIWIDTVNEFQEEIKNNNLQIYKPEEAEESLLGAIKSPEFWASDFADGLGFFASMIVPGAALSKVGTGARVAKFLGAGTANPSKLLKMLGGTGNTAAKIDVGLSTAVNTLFESAAEAGNFRDNLLKDYQRFLGEDGLYTLPDNSKLTQDEVDKIVGSTTANVYNSNLALLVGPNFIVNNSLFGKMQNKNWFKKYATKAREQTPSTSRAGKFADLFKRKTTQVTGREAVDAIEENLGKNLTKGQMVKNASKQLVGGATSEGLVEEGGQMAVENYFSEQAKAGSTGVEMHGLVDAYLEMLSSAEGQQGMFIGALLGGGTQAATINKNEIKERQRKLGLTESIKKGIDNVEAAASIWKIENGKTVLDTEKFAEQLATNTYLAYNYGVLARAAEQGDATKAREAWDNIFVTFAKNYITEEGGLEFMQEHFDSLADSFLQGVNSFIAENSENKTPKEVKEDIALTKEKLYKRAEALRATYEDITTVGSPSFFGLNHLAVDDESLKGFAGQLSDQTLRASNTIFSLEEELEDLQKEIAEHQNNKSVTSDKFIENYLSPKLNNLNKTLQIEKQKYEELFDESKQKTEFKKYQGKEEEKRAENEKLAKKEKDFNERFKPVHKNTLIDKGYKKKVKAEGGSIARAGTYFKDKFGNIYRLSRTEKGKKNSIGSRYDLVDIETGERTAYNDYVGMEMGFENADQILSVKEAMELEKERKKNPVQFVPEDLDGAEHEGGEAKPPVSGEATWSDTSDRKSNPFSTMTAFFNRAGGTNPNGVRWSNYFSQNDFDPSKGEIVFLSWEDLQKIGGVVYPGEVAEEYKSEGNLFSVPMQNGTIITNSENELIYAGVPTVVTLEANKSIVWSNYVEEFMDFSRDFKQDPITEKNGFEYEGNTFTSNDEFYKFIEVKVLGEYASFRRTIKSGSKVKATNISAGVANYTNTIKQLQDVFPKDLIFSVEVQKIHEPSQGKYAGTVSIILKDDQGGPGKEIKVGQNRISERENSQEIVDFLADMFVYANDMDDIYDDIPTSHGVPMKLYSTKRGQGIISAFMRMGKTKSFKPFDLHISNKNTKGGRILKVKDKEGNITIIKMANLADKKSADYAAFAEIVGDKFMNVDLATIKNTRGKKFHLPQSIKEGVVQTKSYLSYTDYLVESTLSTTIDKDSPLVNQYISYDMESLQAPVKKDETVEGEVKVGDEVTSNMVVPDELTATWFGESVTEIIQDEPGRVKEVLSYDPKTGITQVKITFNLTKEGEEKVEEEHIVNIKPESEWNKKPKPPKPPKPKPPVKKDGLKTIVPNKTYIMTVDGVSFPISMDKSQGIEIYSSTSQEDIAQTTSQIMSMFSTDDVNTLIENVKEMGGHSQVSIEEDKPTPKPEPVKDENEEENCKGKKDDKGDDFGGRDIGGF